MKSDSKMGICSIFIGFMYESETFRPIGIEVDYASGYTMPELYIQTSVARLYRVRKAGKYFIIKTASEDTGMAVAMLQREYELSIGLVHPGIVNVFTFEPATIVGAGIVMEYVDGRTLQEFLTENPTQAMRARVFEQLLDAVAYMHRNGIVHNDIKPENILITRTGNDVKLIDFGLADDDAHYLARTLGCTPAYASPELLARESGIDVRSDVYSLGVVMKEIFGNRCRRIAARCLNERKGKRYSNAEELLKAFRHRNRPLKIVSAVLVAVLFLLTLFCYVDTLMAEHERLSERDAIILQMEQAVNAYFQLAMDSIECSQCFESANDCIISFFTNVGEYRNEKVLTITDPELSAVVSDRYLQVVYACQQKLWQKANALPLSYDKKMLP